MHSEETPIVIELHKYFANSSNKEEAETLLNIINILITEKIQERVDSSELKKSLMTELSILKSETKREIDQLRAELNNRSL